VTIGEYEISWKREVAIVWSMAICILCSDGLAATETIDTVARPDTSQTDTFYIAGQLAEIEVVRAETN
jgi:hypothetical protein